MPLSCAELEYRYLVLRRFSTAGEDDGDDLYLIRHWEAGVYPRLKNILGNNEVAVCCGLRVKCYIL